MFKVELEPEALKTKGKHQMYNLRYLLYRRVVVEEPHIRKPVLQCTNCQEFGQLRNYCKLPAVCIICAKLHSTANCQHDKTKPEVKKCGNCGENHTANYRGCAVYKTLFQKMTPRQRAEQQFLNKIYKNPNEQREVSATTNPHISYAEALKGTSSPIIQQEN